MRVNLKAISHIKLSVPCFQFPLSSSKSKAPSNEFPIPSSTPLSYLDIRERSLRSLVLRSGNGTAMGNLENHRRLSASVYSSLPNPGANESVF